MSDLLTKPAAPSLLACVRYGMDAPAAPGDIVVPLRILGGAAAEAWPAAGEVRHFSAQGYDCATDGERLFFRRRDTADQHIEQAAQAAYTDLLALCRDSGYTQLLRIWNYFSGVTEGEGDAERYRLFCLGRHRALATPGFERLLPAATVIGTHEPGLHLYGLASKTPGIQIENPRQTSAFNYPREYGPRSPSFSRATRHGDRLFVSGTAAIVGHQTQHPHDSLRQTGAMLDNLRALLAAAPGDWQAESLKLYLRDPANAGAVLPIVKQALGADAPLLVLHGDVCRRDLMVEIEGVFRTPA